MTVRPFVVFAQEQSELASAERRTAVMELQATIIVSYRADSLAEAGEKLEDVLLRARERDDIEIESIEVHTPVRAGSVTLPRVERGAQPRDVLPRQPARETAPRRTGRDVEGSAFSGSRDRATSQMIHGSGTTTPSSARNISPGNVLLASVRVRSRSLPGQKWVSRTRRAPAVVAASPA